MIEMLEISDKIFKLLIIKIKKKNVKTRYNLFKNKNLCKEVENIKNNGEERTIEIIQSEQEKKNSKNKTGIQESVKVAKVITLMVLESQEKKERVV